MSTTAAPAVFEDAAARYLEETDLPKVYRYDPATKVWHTRHTAGTWTPVATNVVVTVFARFLADEWEVADAQGQHVPAVLSGIPGVSDWTGLRTKLTRRNMNAAVFMASGSDAFHGLPAPLRDAVETPTHKPTKPARASDDAIASWLESALSLAPGSFIRRSAVIDAFRAAHGPDAASRKVVSRVAQDLLGTPRVRSGHHGWPGVALA